MQTGGYTILFGGMKTVTARSRTYSSNGMAFTWQYVRGIPARQDHVRRSGTRYSSIPSIRLLFSDEFWRTGYNGKNNTYLVVNINRTYGKHKNVYV